MKRTNFYFRKTLNSSLFFGLLISIISCTSVENNNTAITSETQQKELQEVISKIKEQNSRFERFYLNGQADSLGLILSENVKQYISHQAPTNSLNEYTENNKQLMSFGNWEFVLTTEEVKLSGQMAVERGKYKFTFTPNEESPIPATLDSGNYIAVWEKFDRNWKIVWDAPVTEIPLQ